MLKVVSSNFNLAALGGTQWDPMELASRESFWIEKKQLLEFGMNRQKWIPVYYVLVCNLCVYVYFVVYL